MVKKQTKAMLIALLMFMQCLYGITLSSKVNATEISGNILDSVTLAVYDSNGQVVTGNVYDQNAQAKLDYTWSLPNGHGYHKGDTFSFTLPQEFLLYNDVSGPLVTADSSTVGTFHADKNSHHVVITFNEFIESHDELKGTLTFLTQFNKSQFTGSTEQTIVVPVRSGDQIFTIKFKPIVDSTISKSGVPRGYNAKSIDWTVDVNKSLDTVQDAVVTDPIVEGLSAPVTITVYHLNVNLNGLVTQGLELDSSSYSVSTEGGALTVHFEERPVTTAYRIIYATKITDRSKSSFTNIATFSGTNREPVQASSTVTVQRGKMLFKEATSHNPITQTIQWAIHYNNGEELIPQSEAFLTDLFDDSHQLVADSIIVYPITFNASGDEVLDEMLDTNAYTILPIAGESSVGFKLQFVTPISSAYKITYSTKGLHPIIENAQITNKVTTSGGISSTAKKAITQVVLGKNVRAVDYKAKTVGWNVFINGDSQEMSHVVLTDTFPSQGLSLILNSIVVTKGNVVLTDSVDYILESADPAIGFIVRFANTITQPVKITYNTKFNLALALPPGSANEFTNQAQMNWITGYDHEEHTKIITAKFTPYTEVMNNGYKSGSYNGVTKELSWKVGINYNENNIEKAVVEDMLEANQTLAIDSLAVHNMIISTDGSNSLGNLVASDQYDYIVTPQNKLIVTFHEPISAAYTIVFKTSLEGQLIPSTVANTAKVFDGQTKVSKDLIATVNIPHGGEYVSKNGSQSGDKINWQVTVNQGQSKLTDAEIYDSPSKNQVVLSDSFHLFSMRVAANGNLTKDIELVKGIGYTVDIQTDTEGNQTFRLKFKNPISTAYVLEYQSAIAARDQESVTNAVSFSGNNVTTVTKETVKEIVVGVSTGSGTGNGVRGSLEVKKVDAANRELPLSGAIYELYRKSGENKYLIQTQTTNETGTALFQGLLAGDYVIKEITAPTGYTLDGSDHPFTLQSAENKKVMCTNARTQTPPPTSTPPPPSSTPTPPPTSTPTPPPTSTPPPPPSSPPPPPPSSSPTPTPSITPSPSITPTPKPTAPVVTVPSPKPSDPGVVAPPTIEPATLPVTGESSHLYVKLAGLTFVLFGVMLGRKVRRKR